VIALFYLNQVLKIKVNTPKMKTILIALIALTIFFAGCSSTPTNETTTTTTQATGQNTVTTQAAAQTAETTPTQATVAQPAVTTPEDNRAKLMNIFGLIKDYVVTYNVTTQRGNNPPSSDQITYYIDGANTRVDTTTTKGADTYETRYYTVNDQSYSCDNGNGSWVCSKIKTPKILADMRQTMLDNIQNSTITQLPDRTISGTDAQCYHLVMNVTNAGNALAKRLAAAGKQNWEGTYCGTDQAIMLYYESTDKGITVTLSATSYHAGTGPSDFTLPADPSGGQPSGGYGLS